MGSLLQSFLEHYRLELHLEENEIVLFSFTATVKKNARLM